MEQDSTPSGPVAKILYAVIGGTEGYREFAKTHDRVSFGKFIETQAAALVGAGLPPEDTYFAKRIPADASGYVAECLHELAARGILPSTAYNRENYSDVARHIAEAYEHAGLRTYIYPEEAELLFAIVNIARPKRTVFLGSYYGFWAHAALHAMADYGGQAVLVDPSSSSQAVAKRNLAREPCLSFVEVVETTGEQYLAQTSESFDLVVMDAENPRTYPDPELQGKRVYASLLNSVLGRLTEDALLVCHNILFENISGCPHMAKVIARNYDELGKFRRQADAVFSQFFECTTTEGTGVWRRR